MGKKSCEINVRRRDADTKNGAIRANRLPGRSGHADLNRSTAFSKNIKPAHKRLSRALGYCLTLATPEAWSGFAYVAAARLEAAELTELAFWSLVALNPETAESVAADALNAAGMPGTAIAGDMFEARLWAQHATRLELKSYALAAFEQLNDQDKAAFFQHISEVELAA